jgi:NAD-dependent deacetylase
MEGKLSPYCQCGGVIKDDGVFFGEPIPSDVIQSSQKEAWGCDLMLICGTSAVVHPFASLPQMANPDTIIIEINAEPTPLTGGISNYLIQGKTGEILPKIVVEVKRIWKG